MNHRKISSSIILSFSIFVGTLSVAVVKAQIIKPDPQIVREMTVYARTNFPAGDDSNSPMGGSSDVVKKTVFTIPDSVLKVSSEMSALEHLAFDWLNQKRLGVGLTPLKWSDDMAKLARYHSLDMAQKKYFSHKESDGSMVNNRASLFGFSDWQSIGENIAFNQGFKLPAESACQQWMNSAPHRENILDKRWNEAGIGAAISADGSYYFTEVFVLR